MTVHAIHLVSPVKGLLLFNQYVTSHLHQTNAINFIRRNSSYSLNFHYMFTRNSEMEVEPYWENFTTPIFRLYLVPPVIHVC